MTPEPPHDILSHIVGRFALLPNDAVIGVAVSGGSDSVALLLALRAAFPEAHLRAATVDHGLRIEAKQEAQWVSALCAELGIDHSILPINDLPIRAPIFKPAPAKRATMHWPLGGRKWRVSCICLGHSQTDVAESFLIRLARGSGVDGLSEMRCALGRSWYGMAAPLARVFEGGFAGFLTDSGTGLVQ